MNEKIIITLLMNQTQGASQCEDKGVRCTFVKKKSFHLRISLPSAFRVKLVCAKLFVAQDLIEGAITFQVQKTRKRDA